jgi:hypothetical protein
MMMMICMIDKRTHMSSVAMIFIAKLCARDERGWVFLHFSRVLQQQQKFCWFSQMQCMVNEFENVLKCL